MAIIKDGFGCQPLKISIIASTSNSHKAEVWTEMFDDTKHDNYEIDGDKLSDSKFRTEVLHYATLNELLELRDNINTAIKEIVGL